MGPENQAPVSPVTVYIHGALLVFEEEHLPRDQSPGTILPATNLTPGPFCTTTCIALHTDGLFGTAVRVFQYCLQAQVIYDKYLVTACRLYSSDIIATAVHLVGGLRLRSGPTAGQLD